MYDELPKRLRNNADHYMTVEGAAGLVHLLTDAADAIEELKRHYCPHAIRNVHDRGDDSICRVLGTEPPKEKT